MDSSNSWRPCPPRYATPRTDRPTHGPVVRRVAEQLGYRLMPWQVEFIDVALEYDPATGELAYRDVGLTIPRQSGKTTVTLAAMVWRALLFAPTTPQRIVYTAQTAKDARSKLVDDQLPILARSPFADHYKPRLTNGSEALRWANGSIHTLAATTESSGHGQVLDMAVVDEAFAQTDFRLEQAFKPAMITRQSPQQWVVSTAGTGDSVFLWSKVERGRRAVLDGLTDGIAYFEWSAPDDADPGDPETWYACMPALGHTQPLSAMRSEYLAMEEKPAEFKRAYLNQWTTGRLLPPIPLDAWASCADTSSRPTDDLAFAVDVSPDRMSASVVVASRRSDGRVHVEAMPDVRSVDECVPWLIERWSRWNPSAVWLDPSGPAGSFIPDLEAAGVKVEQVSTREMGQACSLLHDMVTSGEVVHLNDARILAALDGGQRRMVGDLWVWSRRDSASDITPAVSVTLGVWACRMPPEPKPVDVAANVW